MQIVLFLPHYQLVYINFDFSSFSLISYHPKAVVCFSIPDCFTPFINRLNIKEVESIVPPMVNGEPAKHGVAKAMWGDIKIIGIPHPSGRISYDDLGAIAMFIKKELV